MTRSGWRLPWRWSSREDTTEEARRTLAEVKRRDPEVDALAAKLTEAIRHNHFSELVDQALRRVGESGT